MTIPKINLEPIREILQDKMPVISASPHGRIRLVRALENKYGPQFRSFEIPMKALKHFDEEVKMIREIVQAKEKANGST
jgi:hypothetical protein